MAKAKDYAGMMGASPTPKASPNPDEQMAGGGSVTGATQQVDMMREQIIAQLEQKGVFNQIQGDQEMQEIMALVDQLVEAMAAGDQQAVMQNPLMQLLGAQSPGQAAPQQGMM